MYENLKQLEKIIDKIGAYISYLNIVLIMLICIDVFLRYTFNTTEKWVIELEWHIFALIFLIGASYTFQHDKHVRVDLFYQNYSEKNQLIVNILGNLFLLIPWCIVVIFVSYKYANVSFSYREVSSDPGGLPARYIIKYAIVFGFLLLLAQGILDTIFKLQKFRRA